MSAARWPVAPAAVALDLLDDREEPVARRLIAEDPAFRAEVDRLRATTATLAGLDEDAWAPEAPPALDRGGALREAPEAPEAPPAASPPAAPRRRRPARRRAFALPATALAAAAVAAAVVLATGRGGDDDPVIPPPPPTTLALRPLPGTTGRAQLTLNGAGTEATLQAAGLEPSGADDYYEAWLADDTGRMVSMGTFRVPASGRVDIHMDVAVDVSRYALVDVSLEPDDGDPGHSDRSVLRARL